MTAADPRELADLAARIAVDAGRLLLDGFAERRRVVDTKSSPTDMVTAMDRAAERRVVEALSAARPGDGIVGEEGSRQPSSSGVTWVVDPLDGTTNYLYGFPGWAVSLAAEQEGEVVAGAVAVPTLGDVYTAVRGGGARRGGDALVLGPPPPLARALVATGFAYDPAVREQQAAALVGILPRVRDIRRAGAASVDLCSVAAGRVDAYFERGLAPWDHAAGALVAAEAGAMVGDGWGGPPSARRVVAAHPRLFEPLCELLAAFDVSPSAPAGGGDEPDQTSQD